MRLAYTIISVDESRKELKDGIHEAMAQAGIKPFESIEYVDGRIPGAVEDYISKNDIRVESGNFHYGELGVWFSQINAWKAISKSDYDGVIVFEDDAVVPESFVVHHPTFFSDLPAGFDFMALNVPENQRQDYFYNRVFDENGSWKIASYGRLPLDKSSHYIGSKFVATAYQGYSCVSMMYSPKGAAKLLEIVESDGITGPVDCAIYIESFKKRVAGYTFGPLVRETIGFKELGTIARSTGMYN